MGFWNSVVSGAVNGAANGARAGRLEQICGEVGWNIDERLDDDGIVLHFKCPTVGVRKVLVCAGARVMTISAYSSLGVCASNMPRELAAYLLLRNQESHFGSWRAKVGDGGRLELSMAHTGFLTMDANFFRVTCSEIVKEVNEFDAKMRQARML